MAELLLQRDLSATSFDPNARDGALPDHARTVIVGAGVAGFVLKRSAATDLIPAVQEVLAGGTYVCPCLRGQLPQSCDPSPALPSNDPPPG